MSMSSVMTRRRVIAFGAAACVANFARPVRARTEKRPVVVELFTSQGCSSCPAADTFMGELKSMNGVIAISLHVDYWDYLGWRDTLGDKAYTKRQYGYARSRGDQKVYTPQIVVDGAQHFVGSNKSSVKAAIKRAQEATPTHWVPMTLSRSGGTIVVATEARDNAPESTLWLMTIAPSISVKVERGENAGREIVYYNVVRRLMPAGMWHGKAVTLKYPIDGLLTSDSKGCVALLQTGTVGPVIGAATWGEIEA